MSRLTESAIEDFAIKLRNLMSGEVQVAYEGTAI